MLTECLKYPHTLTILPTRLGLSYYYDYTLNYESIRYVYIDTLLELITHLDLLCSEHLFQHIVTTRCEVIFSGLEHACNTI